MFNHLFVSIWVQILYFGLYSNTTIFSFLTCFQHWPLGALSVGSSAIPSQMFCFLFVCSNSSLHSGTTRCSRLILYITCHRPRISHFSREPLEPFVYPSLTLPHHLAVLFSYMIMILLSFSLSHALLIPFPTLFPLSYSCSSIPFCMCECMCVFS